MRDSLGSTIFMEVHEEKTGRCRKKIPFYLFSSFLIFFFFYFLLTFSFFYACLSLELHFLFFFQVV